MDAETSERPADNILKQWTGRDLSYATEVDADLHHEVSQFLYREARLQDTHEYDAWEALWTDDAVYWVPANGADTDPERQMSLIYDNRSRIALRVRQLKTGRRHSQTPPSQLARIIGNVELLQSEGQDIGVACNSQIFETNLRGDTMWAARCCYRLRRQQGALKIVYKKVVLVNNNKPIYTISFLI
ncbi:aromatic-ring-hydroxylating dioxygenase subunit beta [Rhodopseudomonas sp. AAP120]|uniref:aromatic-ring-hydroxylating dioxygenase subunit beta n=1 Tax=Rhodopseudomonas sp. AAP120 TaxID=1523430 RepID=UPI0009EAA90F|nr:aromatic-ring-hydroxylating dioxygenase subunit beta [Rhodopseudomonas sp. AAP120]